MEFAANTLGPEAMYKLLTGIVVPRPIAWVTTLSPDGGVNLAPFSAFTFVSNKPPMLGINIGRKAGIMKDTANNIHATGEFVVNIPDDSMI
ncbi:MAG: flavin reductase family protein, partial [Pseudomonadota bacterium]